MISDLRFVIQTMNRDSFEIRANLRNDVESDLRGDRMFVGHGFSRDIKPANQIGFSRCLLQRRASG